MRKSGKERPNACGINIPRYHWQKSKSRLKTIVIFTATAGLSVYALWNIRSEQSVVDLIDSTMLEKLRQQSYAVVDGKKKKRRQGDWQKRKEDGKGAEGDMEQEDWTAWAPSKSHLVLSTLRVQFLLPAGARLPQSVGARPWSWVQPHGGCCAGYLKQQGLSRACFCLLEKEVRAGRSITGNHITWVAQWQRVGPIAQRPLDRSQAPLCQIQINERVRPFNTCALECI